MKIEIFRLVITILLSNAISQVAKFRLKEHMVSIWLLKVMVEQMPIVVMRGHGRLSKSYIKGETRMHLNPTMANTW